MTKIMLTGDRPTGKLHIGHYVGSIKIELNYKINMNVFSLLLIYTC